MRSRKSCTMVAVVVSVVAAAAGPSPIGGPVGRASADTEREADTGRIAAGGVLRVSVPEAFGGKTVIGQLTVDQALGPGYVTAYGCDDGLPTDAGGLVSRSDLNFDGRVSPVASNRLVVQADDDGDVCFFTLRPAAMVVDVNAVTFDTGVTSFPNRRTDTRDRAGSGRVAAGGVLRVSVPEAVGGKTVVGQLTVDRVDVAGHVTAYGCDDGLPTDAGGLVSRSDLNFDGGVWPVASNRLIVQADDDGDVCLSTLEPAAVIVDVNGVSDVGIQSFPNRRTDTRDRAGSGRVAAGGVLRVSVPEAVGGKTVVGQLTVDRVDVAGHVTAYGCDDGLPTDAGGLVSRSDLNFDGGVWPVASNRLIVQADDDGDVCFSTLEPAAVIVDVNGVSDVGIQSFPNRRTDTRTGIPPSAVPPSVDPDGVPIWPVYRTRPPLDGVAALTGHPASRTVTRRPIVAVKIDNYGPARPQWGLDRADVVIEEQVEGITRFIGLFHSRLPAEIGPVRSARTGDIDLLSGMNRPLFAYSGANPGVTRWIESAAESSVLVDHSAQRHPCYRRSAERPGPHNLLFDPTCAIDAVPAGASAPGAARPLWDVAPVWTPPGEVVSSNDTTFEVEMDGVDVAWAWDAASGVYLRFQDGQPHVSVEETQISANNVVELAAVHVPSSVDARSPHPITVGTGAAVVHRDGQAIDTIWSRATPFGAFEFFTPVSGASIPLDTGTTFVELVRAG